MGPISYLTPSAGTGGTARGGKPTDPISYLTPIADTGGTARGGQTDGSEST